MEINWLYADCVMQFALLEQIFSDHLRTMSILFNRDWIFSLRSFPLSPPPFSLPLHIYRASHLIHFNLLQFVWVLFCRQLGHNIIACWSNNYISIKLSFISPFSVAKHKILFFCYSTTSWNCIFVDSFNINTRKGKQLHLFGWKFCNYDDWLKFIDLRNEDVSQNNIEIVLKWENFTQISVMLLSRLPI